MRRSSRSGGVRVSARFIPAKKEMTETETYIRPRIGSLKVRRAMNFSIVQGAFMGGFWGAISGVVSTSFLVDVLNASNLWISLVSVAVVMANIPQILCAAWLGRVRPRKPFVISLNLTSAALWACAYTVPFFFAGEAAVYMFFAVVLTAMLAQALVLVPWSTWLADIMPESVRGRLTAERQVGWGLANVFVAIGAGFMIESYRTADRIPMTPFVTLAVISLVCAAAAAVAIGFQYEPATVPSKRAGLAAALREVFASRSFRRVITFYFFWNMIAWFGSPFGTVHLLKNVGMSRAMLGFYVSAGALVMFLSTLFWGKIGDLLGPRLPQRVCVMFTVVVLAAWSFVDTDTAAWLSLVLIVAMSLLTGSITLLSWSTLFDTTPENNRGPYMAAWWSICGVGSLIGSFAGGIAADAIGNDPISVFGGFSTTNYQIILAIQGVLFFALGFFMPRFGRADGDLPVRELTRLLFVRPIGTLANVYQITTASSASSKLKAIDDAGERKNLLVSRTLLKAMDDPDDGVRFSAIRSLGEMRSPEAVAALIGRVNDTTLPERGAAIWALGRTGLAAARDALIGLLDDEIHVAVAAAQALRNYPDAETVRALFAKCRDAVEPRLMPVVINSLSEIGSRKIVGVLAEKYNQFISPIIRRQLFRSLARLYGFEAEYYRLIGLDEFDRDVELLEHMKRLAEKRGRKKIRPLVNEMIGRFREYDFDHMAELAPQLIGALEELHVAIPRGELEDIRRLFNSLKILADHELIFLLLILG